METHYTPTIEEFHPGFEFECKERFLDGTVKTLEDFNNSKWVKQTCNSAIMYIERALNGRNSENGLCGVRVKYLDREGIESLGFELDQCTKDGCVFYKGNLMTKEEWCLTFGGKTNPKNYLSITSMKNNPNSFTGVIKNKSELKRILKQLNIL